jgi:hypothetical protein
MLEHGALESHGRVMTKTMDERRWTKRVGGRMRSQQEWRKVSPLNERVLVVIEEWKEKTSYLLSVSP